MYVVLVSHACCLQRSKMASLFLQIEFCFVKSFDVVQVAGQQIENDEYIRK